jgi:hypothetical protein
MQQHLFRQHAFGIDDKPLCQLCSAPMFVCRRSPAAQPRHELQLLTCTMCSHTLARVVNENGESLLASNGA